MKKQLNVDVIQSELRGGSAFFPGYKGGASPTPAPEPESVAIPSTQAQATERITQATERISVKEKPVSPPERVNARTPVRPSGKRIITRNSFEIYEDQMDSLRKHSLREKMEGKLGSMSQMVREAIDVYLKNRSAPE